MRFNLLSIPVRVRPSFLVIAALLGLSANRVDFMVAWVGILFVSILVHELGHALVARSFGSEVAIELNLIGGLTSWSDPGTDIGPGRRALIAAAGSATGLAFGGIIWLATSPFGPFPPLWAFVVEFLVLVNVFWGLLNWLPIRPLDGGHLFTALLEKLFPSRAEVIGNVVFTLTAALALLVALRFRLLWIAALSAWLLWGEFARNRPQAPRTPMPSTLDFDAPTSDDAGPLHEQDGDIIDADVVEDTLDDREG